VTKTKKSGQKDFINALRAEINLKKKGAAVTQKQMSIVAGLSRNSVAMMKRDKFRISSNHVAKWRRQWRRHISWAKMGKLMEKHLIEEEDTPGS
jgi:hypothetical protein